MKKKIEINKFNYLGLVKESMEDVYDRFVFWSTTEDFNVKDVKELIDNSVHSATYSLLVLERIKRDLEYAQSKDPFLHLHLFALFSIVVQSLQEADVVFDHIMKDKK
jgi:hypothetical protein